jgi:hypothetical protein
MKFDMNLGWCLVPNNRWPFISKTVGFECLVPSIVPAIDNFVTEKLASVDSHRVRKRKRLCQNELARGTNVSGASVMGGMGLIESHIALEHGSL